MNITQEGIAQGEIPQEIQSIREKTEVWQRNKRKQLLDAISVFPNGIKAKDLRKITGLTPRQIRLLVNDLRKQGKPIASGNFGYMLATNTEQVLAVIKRLTAQADEINEIVGQLTLCYRDMRSKEQL